VTSSDTVNTLAGWGSRGESRQEAVGFTEVELTVRGSGPEDDKHIEPVLEAAEREEARVETEEEEETKQRGRGDNDNTIYLFFSLRFSLSVFSFL
jgi:hypothetical protein